MSPTKLLAPLAVAGLLLAGCSKPQEAAKPKPAAGKPDEVDKVKAEVKPAAKPAAKPEAKPEPKPEAKPEAKPAALPPGPIPAPPDVAKTPADAEKTASGLASKVLTPGKGIRHPKAADTVQVHYTGWTTDGKMFDSSVVRGNPTSFPLTHVIAGWTEGVQLMVEGEKRRFWIPVELAYRNRPGFPAGMLVFDVELLKILTSNIK